MSNKKHTHTPPPIFLSIILKSASPAGCGGCSAVEDGCRASRGWTLSWHLRVHTERRRLLKSLGQHGWLAMAADPPRELKMGPLYCPPLPHPREWEGEDSPSALPQGTILPHAGSQRGRRVPKVGAMAKGSCSPPGRETLVSLCPPASSEPAAGHRPLFRQVGDRKNVRSSPSFGDSLLYSIENCILTTSYKPAPACAPKHPHSGGTSHSVSQFPP